MFFPDYFADRSKKCFELAKKIRNPKLAETFAERARVLKQTALEAERTLARAKDGDKPSPPVIVSRATTLGEVRHELQSVSDRTSLCVLLRDHPPDQRNELWRASPQLSLEFGCSAEFRPDGCLWFVKR